MAATLAELEARVAALEADRADYKAVLAAINALGQQTRERLDVVDSRFEQVNGQFGSVTARLDQLEKRTDQRFRSLEDGQSEIKDLLIRALDR